MTPLSLELSSESHMQKLFLTPCRHNPTQFQDSDFPQIWHHTLLPSTIMLKNQETFNKQFLCKYKETLIQTLNLLNPQDFSKVWHHTQLMSSVRSFYEKCKKPDFWHLIPRYFFQIWHYTQMMPPTIIQYDAKIRRFYWALFEKINSPKPLLSTFNS